MNRFFFQAVQRAEEMSFFVRRIAFMLFPRYFIN